MTTRTTGVWAVVAAVLVGMAALGADTWPKTVTLEEPERLISVGRFAFNAAGTRLFAMEGNRPNTVKKTRLEGLTRLLAIDLPAGTVAWGSDPQQVLVFGMAVSADGKSVFVAEEAGAHPFTRSLVRYSGQTGNRQDSVTLPKDFVARCVAVNASGSRVAVGGMPASFARSSFAVHVFEGTTMNAQASFAVPGRSLVTDLAFCPGTNLLAGVVAELRKDGHRGQCVVWDIAGGTREWNTTFSASTLGGGLLAFDAGGSRLAVAYRTDRLGIAMLELWDVAERTRTWSVRIPRISRGLAFSQDGTKLLRGSYTELAIYSTADGVIAGTVSDTADFAVDAAGQYIAYEVPRTYKAWPSPTVRPAYSVAATIKIEPVATRLATAVRP